MNAATVRTLERLEWEFHRRVFGDELARVNFLAPAERRAYVARLRERARHRRSNSGVARRRIVQDLARRGGEAARTITIIMEGQKAVKRLVKGTVKAERTSRKTSTPLD